jgi:dephospho-CoA kinase
VEELFIPDNKILILAVTGLPSSGKGTFTKIAEAYNFKKIVMGDVIRNECAKRNLPVNRESSNKVMVDLRKERGPDAIAQMTLEWIQTAIDDGEQKIIIDGVRSLKEIEFFHKYFPKLKIIGIHANPDTRLSRALERRRMDDAYSEKAFYDRDEIELNLGIGMVIARSDILIDTSDDLVVTNNKMKTVLEEFISNKIDIN